MEVLEAIMARRSVRQYTNEAVADEDVDTLLKAAMQAPTAVNRQPCRFVVVRAQATREALAAGLPYAKMAAHAPVVIAVCGDAAAEGTEGLLAQDGAAATQNILLAACDLGLGAVWTALYPYADRMDCVRQTLFLPQDIVPLALVPVGHPLREPHPEDRFKAAHVHLERW